MGSTSLVRRCWLILAVIVWLAWPRRVAAQAVSEYEVKAAYIYSLAKFVEWPAKSFVSPSAPMRFCILNDHEFEAALSRIVKGKLIAGRPVEVLAVRDVEQARPCHLLFINSAEDRQSRRMAELLRGTNILTIGESDGFLEKGGMINFVLEDSRVQFEINVQATSKSELYVSSRILKVARRLVQ